MLHQCRPMLPQCSRAMLPQCSRAMLPQGSRAMLPQCSRPMLPQCSRAMLPQRAMPNQAMEEQVMEAQWVEASLEAQEDTEDMEDSNLLSIVGQNQKSTPNFHYLESAVSSLGLVPNA